MQKRLRSGGAFLHARLGLDSSRLFAAQNDVEAESSENACIIVEVRSEYSKAADPEAVHKYGEWVENVARRRF